MSEGLLRQRRNLIITSVLLWFLKYGGVRFHKFSLAGFDVELANPEVLTMAIWIAFAYFLYRYYQYFAAEGVSKLQHEFSQSLSIRCTPIIEREVKAAYPRIVDEGHHHLNTVKQNAWVFRGQQVVIGPDGKTPFAELVELRISKWSLRRGIALAVAGSTFRSSVVTDYLLPFALAGFVLWYCGGADWSGSFLNLLFGE